ncbi:MAG: acyltransferase [Promethearchaeota archaeon]
MFFIDAEKSNETSDRILEQLKRLNNKAIYEFSYSGSTENDPEKRVNTNSNKNLKEVKLSDESSSFYNNKQNNQVNNSSKLEHEEKDLKNDRDKNQNNDYNSLKTKDKKDEEVLEPKFEFFLYIILFMLYFYLEFLLPLYLGVIYFKEVFINLFLNYGGVREWSSFLDPILYPIQRLSEFSPIFKDPLVFSIFLTAPLVFIALYLFRLFCAACIVKFYYWAFNKIWHRRELINALPYGNITDVKNIHIYHTRNFILRIIKWDFSKSFFPWLTTWMFRFIGSNKIGKNVVIEDSLMCMEYLEMEDNSYIGQMSITSSHLMEGQYGALSIKKIKVGKNSVIGAFNLIPPGVELGDNCQMLAMSGCLKFTHLKSNKNYWGLPSHRISNSRYRTLIQLPTELQNRNKTEKN